MNDTPDPRFAAWMKAERDSYEAIHQLQQSTQGGRRVAKAEAMARISALRREADRRLAELCRTEPTIARVDARVEPELTRLPFARAASSVSSVGYKH
ncbi:hypothetical protein [Pseudacidovorax sp. RU35E]|uniref:hypothetical protein n=1 Tax=Pseudacidovorax sp. RU35E TaxID=1907403 RepID=UPI0009573982|nr:hypothetical protein [Pseudacidovorax sp. RU35E]SIP91121.1 hypothetical protein SAMN05880557_10195 [Pseudacidovorax sp. RU35E]